ncbi:hypothetical protein NSQ26_00060 [Bacillus sp. FSL W7-1360]
MEKYLFKFYQGERGVGMIFLAIFIVVFIIVFVLKGILDAILNVDDKSVGHWALSSVIVAAVVTTLFFIFP